MLTCRTLHLCRVAICSMLWLSLRGSRQAIGGLANRVDKTRASLNAGRPNFMSEDANRMRICRDFLDGGFCQGIDSV